MVNLIVQNIIQKVNNGDYKNIYDGKLISPIKSLDMMEGYLNIDFNGNLFYPTNNGKNIVGNYKDYDIDKLEKAFSKNQKNIFIKSKETFIK